MHVILLDDVSSLGAAGQIVEVPDGYAENFLFPQHLAAVSKPETDEQKGQSGSLERRRNGASVHDDIEQELAADLDGLEVVVTAPVKGNKFKKPVTATELRSALKEMGYTVEKKYLTIDPILEPGEVEVTLNFPSGFEAKLKVIAEAE